MRRRDRDRPRATAARRERRVCERDALPRARLRRHPLGLGQPRLDRDRARGARRGRAARAPPAPTRSPRSSPATRSCAGSAWRPRASSTPRLPSHRDLRRLRRRRRRRPARRPRRRRRRRARWESPARSPAGCSPTSPTAHRRSRCTPPGLRTARTSPSRSPRTARSGRSRCSRASSGSTTRSSAQRRERSTSPASSPISGRAGRRPGSPTSRSRSATSCTARSVRPPAAASGGRTFAPDEIDDVLVSVPEAGVSLVLEPARAEAARRVRSTRASSRCSTPSPRCSCAATSAVADFTDEAIARPGRARRCGKVRYETRDYPTYPQAFPGGVVVTPRRRDDRSRATSRIRRAARRIRSRPTRCVAKFRGNASLALSERARRGPRGRGPRRSRTHDDLTAALAPLALLEAAMPA